MKILKDVATAAGQTLWHVSCEIGTGIYDHGQAKYGNLFLMQDDDHSEIIVQDHQHGENDDNLTAPSSPKFVADMSELDPDLALDLNETSWGGSFFASDLVFNGLVNLTIEYSRLDFNDIPLIQDDIVYYG